jgi:hypothetical protein
MNFILVLITSSAPWFPTNVTEIAFDTKEHCEQALTEAKKQWATDNFKSHCVDLDKAAAIHDAEEKLKQMKKQ